MTVLLTMVIIRLPLLQPYQRTKVMEDFGLGPCRSGDCLSSGLTLFPDRICVGRMRRQKVESQSKQSFSAPSSRWEQQMPFSGWQCTQISTGSCTRNKQGRVCDVGGDAAIAQPPIGSLACHQRPRPVLIA
jgi:hypothetical protein